MWRRQLDSFPARHPERASPVGEAVKSMCERVRALVSAGGVGVMLVNAETWELECQHPAFELPAEQVREFHLPVAGNSVSAKVVRTGQSYLTHDAPHDENLITHFVAMCGTRNMVSFRLQWQGTPLGVVHATNKAGRFSAEDMHSLESFSPLFASMLVYAHQRDALARLHELPDFGAWSGSLAAGCGQVFDFLVQQAVERLGGEAASVWVQLTPGGPLHRLAATDPENQMPQESSVVMGALRHSEPFTGCEGLLGIPWGVGTWPRGVVVVQGAAGRFQEAVKWVLGMVRDGFQQEAVIWAQRELLRAVAAEGLAGLCGALEKTLGMPAAVVDDRGLYLASSSRFVYPSRLRPDPPRQRGTGWPASFGIYKGEQKRGSLVLWTPPDATEDMRSLQALLEYAATLGAAGWPAQPRKRECEPLRTGKLDALLEGRLEPPAWLQQSLHSGSAILAVVSGADVEALAAAEPGSSGQHPWSQVLVTQRDDHGVLLAAARSVQAAVDHLAAAAERQAATHAASIIVLDEVVSSSGEVPDSYRRCKAGLRLIRALGGAGGLYRLSLLGPARLLLGAELRELRRLLDLVRRLQVGPIDKSVILAQTYVAYADAGENVERAAASLHVHPNTLRYRLSKLADLGITHEESAERLTLYMALRLFVFLQGSVFGMRADV